MTKPTAPGVLCLFICKLMMESNALKFCAESPMEKETAQKTSRYLTIFIFNRLAKVQIILKMKYYIL